MPLQKNATTQLFGVTTANGFAYFDSEKDAKGFSHGREISYGEIYVSSVKWLQPPRPPRQTKEEKAAKRKARNELRKQIAKG